MNIIHSTENNNWHHDINLALAELNIEGQFFFEDRFSLLQLKNFSFAINLVSLIDNFQPQDLLDLQDNYSKKGVRLIHIWEDVWLIRSEQVLARLASLLGLNKRIHGRKTKIVKITKPVADQFLNENHLQGAVSSRYKLGLFEKDTLVAVATFSALRKMNHTENYKSAELIRFAVKAGYSVTGGLSKLISFFSTQYQPNDLMTYADRDWSAGEAYVKLGFVQTDVLQPQYFSIDKNLVRALIKDDQLIDQKVFNTGSLKYILKF
ncbi:hypothetical protein EZ449_18200 [Pedobacter frigidisoli]|uniref:Uncharacterized protein n=1 Tax=Pedobacter frigidisoli TaxID=2530455 RepID=A0A4R0NST1_9SPHI|nr:hypothetical protein [Pedobacter frigidisoli]TCD04241.1 hypothetical protein EZ449_18200 [Pedobacter frigidisoli]